MAELYKSLIAGMSEDEKSKLKQEQRDWLKSRALCGSANVVIDCLKDAYDKRIGALKNKNEGLHTAQTSDATSGSVEVPFTIKSGELKVFGYVLTSKEISAKEDEYNVSFHESPDKRWVVIGYDEPFEKTLVWLYDRTSKTLPIPVKATRVGKHFGVDWYGNSVFAVYFGGMGYKTSQLFTVETPNKYIQVESIIKYDPVRDIYARLDFDKNFIFHLIVGRAFDKNAGEEKFPIQLDTDDLVDAISLIKEVKFGKADVAIAYERGKGVATDKHKSIIIENAK